MPNIMEMQKEEPRKNDIIKKQDDTKFIIGVIIAFLFVAWLIAPPGNKFLQLGYFTNNIKYQIDRSFNKDKAIEYKHFRNNAIYIAKMYPQQPKRAILLIDKAIASVPPYIEDSELSNLYKDRAYIKLFLKDKQGALDDFLRSSAYFDVNDDIRIAALLAERKQYKMATKYCDDILSNDLKAFYGYACLSHIYEKAGYMQTAISLYDLAIDRKPNNAKAYVERARLKQNAGDTEGYNADIAKAKELSPNVDINSNLINEILNIKQLSLPLY